ncbi:PoNe immunity protein domain-containing protein [Pseudomonas sp. SMV7]|uniref:PoNi-like cognate immunity protein n=1 Tax=Pseudomonas sp. SMV7 TaxID=3390194 RepID=UPI003F8712A2
MLQEAAYLDSISFWQEFYVEREAEPFLKIERPDYVDVEMLSWDWCYESLNLLIALYSGGEPIKSLEFYAEHMFNQFQRHKRSYPEFSFKLREPDAYQFALWLLSLAVLLDMPERIEQIAGYIRDDPDHGQDLLIRQLFTRVGINLPGQALIHLRPYAELLQALDGEQAEQQQAMRSYLKKWYRGMRNCSWHDLHKARSDAGFFGYWAFEAGMVTVLWGVDDTPYRDLPYYPKDLVDDARERQIVRDFEEGL